MTCVLIVIVITKNSYFLSLYSLNWKTMKKPFEGIENVWINFSKPVVNVDAPFISMAVGGKTKHP